MIWKNCNLFYVFSLSNKKKNWVREIAIMSQGTFLYPPHLCLTFYCSQQTERVGRETSEELLSSPQPHFPLPWSFAPSCSECRSAEGRLQRWASGRIASISQSSSLRWTRGGSPKQISVWRRYMKIYYFGPACAKLTICSHPAVHI
jgi:hypothetical protein